MKKMLLCAVLLSLSISVFADETKENGIITMAGNEYYRNNQFLSQLDYVKLLQTCPQAYQEYEQGEKLRRTSLGFAFSGLALVVIGSPVGITGVLKDNAGLAAAGFVLMGGGLILDLVAIPLSSKASEKKTNAYQTYNLHCTSSEVATLRVKAGPQSIGLALDF